MSRKIFLDSGSGNAERAWVMGTDWAGGGDWAQGHVLRLDGLVRPEAAVEGEMAAGRGSSVLGQDLSNERNLRRPPSFEILLPYRIYLVGLTRFPIYEILDMTLIWLKD